MITPIGIIKKTKKEIIGRLGESPKICRIQKVKAAVKIRVKITMNSVYNIIYYIFTF